MYGQKSVAKTPYQKNCVIRDIAVIELLFATRMRISELCNLRPESVDLIDRSILIYGKGAKERRLQIGNDDVLRAVEEYYITFQEPVETAGFFFVNRLWERLSEHLSHILSSLKQFRIHKQNHQFTQLPLLINSPDSRIIPISHATGKHRNLAVCICNRVLP